MPEPPGANYRCKNEQAEDLVAAEEACLLVAPLLLGSLLLMRLDAGFYHAGFFPCA